MATTIVLNSVHDRIVRVFYRDCVRGAIANEERKKEKRAGSKQQTTQRKMVRHLGVLEFLFSFLGAIIQNRFTHG